MRTVVYRFEDLAAFAAVLVELDQELGLPAEETVGEGEWVLAMFEIGASIRATAAAGRGIDRGDGTMALVFEQRDWDRLSAFANAQSEPALRVVSTTVARVLVVDDDPDLRDVLGAMLESVGLVVEAVESAEVALERLGEAPIDLIVLDWNLPGMTGIDLCREVRRDARWGGLPVLFLSAHSSSKDVVEAFASGADDYVVKPFRAPELGARIFGLLRRARGMQASL